MNFDFIPELLLAHYGYLLRPGPDLCCFSSVVLYRFFKRSGWL